MCPMMTDVLGAGSPRPKACTCIAVPSGVVAGMPGFEAEAEVRNG